MSISIVVPVRNEEAHIARTLDQLLQQERDGIRLEVFVVDGHSTDRTREIVQSYLPRFPELRLLENPKRLSSAARNLAIHHSTGAYFLVIDGHCEIPSRTYFVDLLRAFHDSGVDCLGRPQPLDVSHASTLQKAIAAARSSRLGHHPDSFIYSNEEVDCDAASVAIAYRREVFERIGVFDERFDACEDYEFNCRADRAGFRCRLIPRLTIKYEPRNSLRGLFRQLFRYGRGRIRLYRKHAGEIGLGTIIPAAFVLGVILGPALCLALPLLWPLYFLAIGLYLAAVLLESLRIAWVSRDWRQLPWLPAVFFAIHFGSGCGLLWEWLAGEKVERIPH